MSESLRVGSPEGRGQLFLRNGSVTHVDSHSLPSPRCVDDNRSVVHDCVIEDVRDNRSLRGSRFEFLQVSLVPLSLVNLFHLICNSITNLALRLSDAVEIVAEEIDKGGLACAARAGQQKNTVLAITRICKLIES